MMLLNLGAGHGDQIVNQVGKVKFLLHKLHLAGLDLAHVQHLIDQTQQVLAGKGNLLQAVLYPNFIVNMGSGNGGHADNAVHGGADVVGHIGQEVGLGAVGCLRRIIGFLQRHFLLSFFLDQIIHVPGSDHRRKAAFLIRHKGNPCLKVDDTIRRQLFIGHGVIRSAGANSLQRQTVQKNLTASVGNPLPGVAGNSLGPASVIPAEVILDGTPVLFLGTVGGHGIRVGIDQQHGIVFRGKTIDNLPLGLHLPCLLQLAAGFLVHIPDTQNEGNSAVGIDGFDHVHFKESNSAVHIPPVARLVKPHIRNPAKQVLQAGCLPDPLLILGNDECADIFRQNRLIIALPHQVAQQRSVDADAVGTVQGNGAGFRVDFEQAVVLLAQGVHDGHFFLQGEVRLLHLRQGILQLFLLGKLLPLLLVHILEGENKFLPAQAGSHQLALEMLGMSVPVYPEIEIVALPLCQQLLHTGNAGNRIEQIPVALPHFPIDVGAHILLIVAHGKLLSVPVPDGFTHAVADCFPCLHVHGVDIFKCHRKGKNQVILGFQPLPLRCNPPQTHDDCAVSAGIVPLHGDDAAPGPAAAFRHELLQNDGAVPQPVGNGVKVGKRPHRRLVFLRHKRIRHPPQEQPGIAAVPVDMMNAVQGDDLLHGIALQIHIVQRVENAAQGADDRRMLPLGFQQSLQLLIGLLQFLLRFQLPDFCLVDALCGKDYMGQASGFIPAALNKGALGPGRSLLRDSSTQILF